MHSDRDIQTAPTREGIDRLEAAMLPMPQVECPVVHHFGPGVYMREVSMPAGTLAIGHRQKREHLNIILKGRVAIIGDDGQVRELAAPMTFTGKPGRKVGYVLEDMVWLNVYGTDERDIDTLEATYIDKSAAWEESSAASLQAAALEREADRADYLQVLHESGITHEVARAQSTDTRDFDALIDCGPVRVLPSPIEGRGVFLSSPVEAGEVIAPALRHGVRTLAGRFTNHSATPNAVMVRIGGQHVDLVALRRIAGCMGGGPGEEVTIDYRQALALHGIQFHPKEAACLQ